MTTNVDEWSISKLFDHLQEYLGVGDFSGEPQEYHAWRMRQIGVLKRVMKHRHVTHADLLMCADYCKAHRIQPESHPGLLYHFNEAKRWDYSRKKARIDEEIADILALEQERSLSDEEASRWVDMLLRVTGAKKKEVVERWQKERR